MNLQIKTIFLVGLVIMSIGYIAYDKIFSEEKKSNSNFLLTSSKIDYESSIIDEKSKEIDLKSSNIDLKSSLVDANSSLIDEKNHEDMNTNLVISNSLIKQKINVYIFSSYTCPHCTSAKTFFESISDKYFNCFKLVDYEISDPINKLKYSETREKLEIKETGVPLIIIGSEHFLGYHESLDEEIISIIVKNCTSSNYKDLINPIY